MWHLVNNRLSARKCDECGMEFCPSIPSNAQKHRRWHDEFVKGIRAKQSKTEKILWREGDVRITLVTPTSQLWQRKRAEKVGRRANCETRYDFGVYSAYDPSGSYVLLAHLLERVVGILILTKAEDVWWTTWEDLAARRQPTKVPVKDERWTARFIWLLSKLRGRGIATRLVHIAANYVGCGIQDLCYYAPPFTESGEKLLRSLCPQGFHIGK